MQWAGDYTYIIDIETNATHVPNCDLYAKAPWIQHRGPLHGFTSPPRDWGFHGYNDGRKNMIRSRAHMKVGQNRGMAEATLVSGWTGNQTACWSNTCPTFIQFKVSMNESMRVQFNVTTAMSIKHMPAINKVMNAKRTIHTFMFAFAQLWPLRTQYWSFFSSVAVM